VIVVFDSEIAAKHSILLPADNANDRALITVPTKRQFTTISGFSGHWWHWVWWRERPGSWIKTWIPGHGYLKIAIPI
jgi:hypothetical protein